MSSSSTPSGQPGQPGQLGQLPLRPALKTNDEANRTPPPSGSAKAVQINEPDIPPLDLQPKRQYSAGVAKRLSGRPGPNPLHSPSVSQGTLEEIGEHGITASPGPVPEDDSASRSHHSRRRINHISEKLVAQVADWLEHEKTKKEARKSRKFSSRTRQPPSAEDESRITRARAGSVGSESSDVSLDRLQRILDDSMAALGLGSIPHFVPHMRRGSSNKFKKLQLSRAGSSDTEYYDGDAVVPGCDAVLDNSKTMSYSGGATGAEDGLSLSSRREEKEKQAWLSFKNEIIRLAHTLKLKGWRRMPLDGGHLISVERLSGALTNAVYVVTPPKELPDGADGKKPPAKVLLRVYGPQVEHLIDRENELNVLRRLARKKIGPRVLGTFTNGRFEQYFNATTLTAPNLREPETSKQIAKRMRELHDGLDLLQEEVDFGPSVWRNWDSWIDLVGKTVTALDKIILAGNPEANSRSKDVWRSRGFICGTEWQTFKDTVDKYRLYLQNLYGTPKAIKERLVFAHNDTQYGNILRVKPDDEKSPLLQPANKHKQLIVIDFEYAGANLPGLEFANHFTEWAYNYHDPNPYLCHTSRYPTAEEQHRFIKAYVDHRSQFNHTGSSTPTLTPLSAPGGTPTQPATGSSSSIVDFMLDARVPPSTWKEEETRREEQTERMVQELLEETRLWRVANTAQWVAWGIVQAKVPGTEGADEEPQQHPREGEGEGDVEGEDDEFDYLSYAQDRALFFWGDCIQLGLAKLEDLPEAVRPRVKFVER